MLHVTNGESAGSTLRHANLGGAVSIYADVLHEGPVPAGIDDERLRELRANFLSSRYDCTFDDALGWLIDWEAALDRAPADEEIVLWFEHDLFDQLILIKLLDRFAHQPHPALSLISIDHFPGVEPFVGLGQLDQEQLASLFPFRQLVTREQLDLASNAWNAFRSNSPHQLQDLVDSIDRKSSALPFLAGALRRYFEEFPSLANGLTRTERQTLKAAAEAPSTAAELFKAMSRLEERPFMGDATYFATLRDLARGERPLVRFGAAETAPDLGGLRDATVVVTSTGEDVLDGRNDRIQLNGIDFWRGGVHLTRDSRWRWDDERQRLVEKDV